MARALLGAVAGAVVLFILGFIFYATPLQGIASAELDDSRAAAVQQSLAANLPRTATYHVPFPDTPAQNVMYGKGPIATIHYNSRGFATADPGVMLGGFLHMLAVSILMAGALLALTRYVTDFREQMKLMVLAALAATLFMRLRDPIWYHHDWVHAVYLFVGDSISLIAAGFAILKLLPHSMKPAATGRDGPIGP